MCIAHNIKYLVWIINMTNFTLILILPKVHRKAKQT